MYSGTNIRKIRLLKGLNQKGIATRLGISQQAYSKIEKQTKIPEARIMTLLNAIGANLTELSAVNSIN